jgi:hypothetical protein
MSGIAGCCAGAASGHAAAAPPSSVMNSRRFQLIELHSVPCAARAGLQDIELARVSQEVVIFRFDHWIRVESRRLGECSGGTDSRPHLRVEIGRPERHRLHPEHLQTLFDVRKLHRLHRFAMEFLDEISRRLRWHENPDPERVIGSVELA